ncbi:MULTISPECIES: NAD-dependent epimerase/dehydratase family protein [Arthrobacter]|uniref:NAD-dependent epimerase/dehydratase family protein n=2 Tax=Arthrobacter TaxID=1663 RepID=A0ABU9KRG1_9MICC|nr:NAD-dependent epimerase/dehydratase family protein [Arthrobacter sp. YJM1]MDP5228396.1 NAD-dependent epimerase/dehydratase family protein [Arthrobacter sp. YJM1]
MKVAVTGATGFVGRHVVRALLAEGHEVVALVRSLPLDPGVARALDGAHPAATGDLERTADFSGTLRGVDAVVHLAARVHRMEEDSTDPLAAHRAVNTELTRRLAEAAAEAGVTSFVFLSSIKVNGERTEGVPFAAGDEPAPVDPYGVSKWEAEQALATVCRSSRLRGVSIRIPMVYGPGNKGNVQRLLGAVRRGLPLPLASIRNRRTMVAVGNVCSAIVYALSHGSEQYQLILAADSRPVSTADLCRALGTAAGRRAVLLPFPPALLRLGARLVGKGAEAERLTEDLEVRVSGTAEGFAWTPPVSFEDGIRSLSGGS